MSSQLVKKGLAAVAQPRFRDLKYKLLGLPRPQALSHEYVAPKTWTETDTLQYLTQTRVLAQSAIALLARATDLNAQLPLRPPIRAQMRAPDGIETLLRQDTDLTEVLPQLTAYDYGARLTERICNFLTYQLRPGHSLDLSADMYNRAIGYFLAINDVQMAQLLFHQMQIRGVAANTATLNLLLASQARRISANPYPLEQLGHPLLMTISLLRKMDRLQIKANSETWNMVLQCMPFGFGKSFLVEEMDRRGIPLNSSSQQVCLETIISERGPGRKGNVISPKIYAAVLSSLDLENPIMRRLVIDRALLQKLPDNKNVESALKILWGASIPDRSTETLNVFLRRFAGRKHLDWQFGILGNFRDTPWNSETWEYIIQCASAMFYSLPQRYVMIGTVLKQAERENVVLTPRARVHARRALREASMRGRKLLDLGPAGWGSLKLNLQWVPGSMHPQNESYLGYIGFGPDSEPALKSTAAALDSSRFAALPTTNSVARRQALHAALEQPTAHLWEKQRWGLSTPL